MSSFPQTRFDGDPAAVRDFAHAAEELGYSHMLVYDHVLGAEHEGAIRSSGAPTPSSIRSTSRSCCLGYIAAITTRIELGQAS